MAVVAPLPDRSTYESRVSRVQEELERREADALILPPGDNQYYLTGNPELQIQPRHTFFILPANGSPFLFMSKNNERNIRPLTWVDDIIVWDDNDDPVKALATAISNREIPLDGTIVTEEQLWALFLRDLESIIDGDIVVAPETVLNLRMVKEEPELEAMREAARITDEVSEEIRSMDAVGMTENDVVAEIRYRMQQLGSDGGVSAFPIMAASGPNSAKPSYYPTRHIGRREIQAGEPVVLDFGAEVNGYLCDQSRVVVFDGTPSDAFVDAFDVVREAQQSAIEAIEPGVEAREIDRVARSIIDDAGYGENFLHVTGHGVGIGVHEPPYLISGEYVGEGNRVELKPGMVLTVEPGIYTDDWGIRLEEEVLVTQNGNEQLTGSDAGWQPLG